MIAFRCALLGIFFAAMAATSVPALADGPPEGFTPLFNGEDLTGWYGDERLWKVADGAIVGSTDDVTIETNSFLLTEKSYGDFVLLAKVKLRNHNSGIQFRSEPLADYAAAGYQADIAESTYFGMLYEERKRGFMDYWKAMTPEERAATQEIVKHGDWNQFEIVCRGDYIKITLNGEVTCEIHDPEGARDGVFGLQLHTGPDMEVSFKDIYIKEFAPDPMVSPRDSSLNLMPDVEQRRDRFSFRGERFITPEGFTVEEVASDDLIGSVINMSFDHKGRPVVASEPGGMRILIDTNGDGIYDEQKSFSEDVRTAMGMHFVGPGDLLVHSRGPEDAALYRVRDLTGNDEADTLEMVMKSNGGIGEHGPHTIMTGPDGYLYILYGNHARPAGDVSPLSPLRDSREDNLLPRYVDPRGHANNVMAPGGTIQRVNPLTGEWSQIVGGFRNPYDMAMNLEGEIFTFDADMEWDFGLPWFRPIRVVHAIQSGDYGWRTGSSKMPFYFIDTLPSVDDVGRGSPVGVAFYYHDVYPEKFRGAFFMGDWSRGRIRVLFPERDGATYSGQTVDFVVGEPLNVTDLDVGPDGFLYFATGGRGTHGGLYRVRYDGPGQTREASQGIMAVLDQPMPRSAWGKEAIAEIRAEMGVAAWTRQLREALADTSLSTERRLRALEALQIHGPKPTQQHLEDLLNDRDPMIRAQAIFLLGTFPLENVRTPLTNVLMDEHPFVLRRACEALVRAGLDSTSIIRTPKETRQRLLMLLNNDDRWVRYAARKALERVHKDEWPAAVLADSIEKRPNGALEGLLALVMTQQSVADADAIFAKLEEYSQFSMDADTMLDYLRVVSLAFIRDYAQRGRKDDEPDPRSDFKHAVGPRLLEQFPREDRRVNHELQRVLAYMETPGTQDKLLAYLSPAKPQEEQIHTVYSLRAMKTGWTPEQRAQLVKWFDIGREIGGAASMEGYIENLWQATLALLPDDERQLAEKRKEGALLARQQRALALIAQSAEQSVSSELAQMSFEELADYLEYDPMSYRRPNLRRGEEVFRRAKCADCHVFGSIGTGGGPDLSTVASRFRRRDLLESIMYPSRVVSDQYAAVDLELKDFSSVTGMIAGETDDTMTLITVHGERVLVPKNQIESRRDSQLSMMPDGLLNTMSLGELVDLVQFLEHGADF